MNEYAAVFIDNPGGTLGVVFEVQNAVGARLSGSKVVGEHVEVDIIRNSDAGQAPGFLGFPLVAEVYPKDGCDLETLITAVASLNSALEAGGYHYVTSADFEDRLPNQGRNVPLS